MTTDNSSVRLGDLLTGAGLLQASDLREAMLVAKQQGLPVGRVLIMSGYLTENHLQAAVQAQSLLKDGLIDLETVINALTLVGNEDITLEESFNRLQYTQDTTAITNKLGELLVEAEIVSAAALSASITQCQQVGLPLGRVLVVNGIITESMLAAALNSQVLIRDKKLTRDQAIQALKSARDRQIPIEQYFAEKGVVQLPTAATVRIGELFVMSHLVDEQNIMGAVEIGLLSERPLGQVLLQLNLITQEGLDAALALQKAVAEGHATKEQAAHALAVSQQQKISAMDAMQIVRPPAPPVQPTQPPQPAPQAAPAWGQQQQQQPAAPGGWARTEMSTSGSWQRLEPRTNSAWGAQAPAAAATPAPAPEQSGWTAVAAGAQPTNAAPPQTQLQPTEQPAAQPSGWGTPAAANAPMPSAAQQAPQEQPAAWGTPSSNQASSGWAQSSQASAPTPAPAPAQQNNFENHHARPAFHWGTPQPSADSPAPQATSTAAFETATAEEPSLDQAAEAQRQSYGSLPAAAAPAPHTTGEHAPVEAQAEAAAVQTMEQAPIAAEQTAETSPQTEAQTSGLSQDVQPSDPGNVAQQYQRMQPQPVPAQNALTLYQFLQLAGLITNKDIENAIRVGSRSPEIMGKMLMYADVLTQPTVEAAQQCSELVSRGILTTEQGIIVLKNCEHNHTSIHQVFADLGWDASSLGLFQHEPVPATSDAAAYQARLAAQAAHPVSDDTYPDVQAASATNTGNHAVQYEDSAPPPHRPMNVYSGSGFDPNKTLDNVPVAEGETLTQPPPDEDKPKKRLMDFMPKLGQQ